VPGKNARPYLKNSLKIKKRAGGRGHGTNNRALTNKCKALSSNLRT
jgi:hypothetical protein